MRFIYNKRGTKRFNNRKKVVVTFKVSAAHCAYVDPREFAAIQARGVAVYHPDDQFDPVYGKRLAETRAKCKLFRKSVNALKRALAKKLRELEELQETLEKQERFLEKEIQHEESLLVEQL